METKGIEEMTKEELIELVCSMSKELKNEKVWNECQRKRIDRLELIINSIGIAYEAYQSDKMI